MNACDILLEPYPLCEAIRLFEEWAKNNVQNELPLHVLLSEEFGIPEILAEEFDTPLSEVIEAIHKQV